MVDNGFGNSNNRGASALEVFGGYLYMSTTNSTTGMEVWRTQDGTDWEQVGFAGFGDSNNSNGYWDNAMTAFNNRLFTGTSNGANGGEIWKKTVTADFAASPLSGPPPLTVVFTNTSAGDYITAQWDFGNGQSFNGTLLLPPTQVYSSTGSYTVTLTVSDGIDTSTLTRANYIRVMYQVYLPVVMRN